MSKESDLPEYSPSGWSRSTANSQPVSSGMSQRQVTARGQTAVNGQVPLSYLPTQKSQQPGRERPNRDGSVGSQQPSSSPSVRRVTQRLPKVLKQKVGRLSVISPQWQRWLANWKLWSVVMILLTSGTGVLALAVLLRLPGLPNCPAVFWPLAPASLRFECGRIAASKRSIKDLLEAIALVDSLPPDHPLRDEADRLVEVWAEDVLRLADESFNQGRLEEAISAARQIPAKTSAYRLVDERVQRWQSIWQKAEDIYRQAEAAMRKLDWKQAFNTAVRLLDLENEYWRTTKYEELNNRINTAREDGEKYYKAERLADAGGVDNLLEAIKLVDSIRRDSYIYEAAQKLIPKYGQRLLDLAQQALERRDLQEALSIVGKIPEKARLEANKQDFTVLANAQSLTWHNTVSDFEQAIAQVQQINVGRPLYRKAQQLIERWQQEIQGLAQIERSRMIAQGGTINDLQAAIAQASLIPSTNPRWQEAQQQIGAWRNQIEVAADRPILSEAELTASQGDLASLQAAIAQANQIAPGRALYREAQRKIQGWTATIQEAQDRPILEQAQQYADAGNLSAAIATAEQIRSGRSLYETAQSKVRSWRNQIQSAEAQAQAQRDLQTAFRMASTGTALDLVNAIQTADQVAGSTSLRGDADRAIEGWSRQLLDLAQNQANYDLTGAIAIAQKIPPKTSVYDEAQTLLQNWKKLLTQTQPR